MEDRVESLESLVGDLRAQVAAQSAHIEHLTKAVEGLRAALVPISTSVHKGQGALAAMMLVVGLIASAVTMAVQEYLSR
jgi:hypothetical protein